jgi:membrane protein YqaA with SNARE-associated domain
VAVSLGRPKMSLVYALMSTVASTLGNIVGYSIGRAGGKALLEKRVNHRVVEQARELLHRYDIWATAIACFTPFPDKVYSLFAGAFHLKFRTFVIVIFLARAARFYLIPDCLRHFFRRRTGEGISPRPSRYHHDRDAGFYDPFQFCLEAGV